jgi:malonyl-ACP decarboxylase
MTAAAAEPPDRRAAITGVGAVTPFGPGCAAFGRALREGRSAIRALGEGAVLPGAPAALLEGAWFEETLDALPELTDAWRHEARRAARRSPPSVQASVLAALEACSAAGLTASAAGREALGVIVAGHNLSPRYGEQVRETYAERPDNVTPRYAVHFLDTDHVGTLSEILGCRGEGMTIGGASASGNVGIWQGLQRIRAGGGACLVVGAMMDLSGIELRAFRSAGALAALEDGDDPARICRPFDRDRRGFVYGQASACLVLEPLSAARARGARIWGEVAGASVALDGNRSADPHPGGQARAMRAALLQAGLGPDDLHYLNAHATASQLGDEVELTALADVLGAARERIWLNSTKALTGHALTAAGVVEAVATILQMDGGFVHPNPSLVTPLRPDFRFAGDKAADARIDAAMSNSFGFGGFNTSVVLKRSTETCP